MEELCIKILNEYPDSAVAVVAEDYLVEKGILIANRLFYQFPSPKEIVKIKQRYYGRRLHTPFLVWCKEAGIHPETIFRLVVRRYIPRKSLYAEDKWDFYEWLKVQFYSLPECMSVKDWLRLTNTSGTSFYEWLNKLDNQAQRYDRIKRFDYLTTMKPKTVSTKKWLRDNGICERTYYLWRNIIYREGVS